MRWAAEDRAPGQEQPETRLYAAVSHMIFQLTGDRLPKEKLRYAKRGRFSNCHLVSSQTRKILTSGECCEQRGSSPNSWVPAHLQKELILAKYRRLVACYHTLGHPSTPSNWGVYCAFWDTSPLAVFQITPSAGKNIKSLGWFHCLRQATLCSTRVSSSAPLWHRLRCNGLEFLLAFALLHASPCLCYIRTAPNTPFWYYLWTACCHGVAVRASPLAV